MEVARLWAFIEIGNDNLAAFCGRLPTEWRGIFNPVVGKEVPPYVTEIEVLGGECGSESQGVQRILEIGNLWLVTVGDDLPGGPSRSEL
jgi:hypothetical protein